jgi:hypothetical protein
MTWHTVELGIATRSFHDARKKMWEARKWCADSLSSHGVLWKNISSDDWSVFYFAQPQDAVLFKLMFG